LQRSYLDLIRKFIPFDQLSETDRDILSKWDFTLRELELDPMRLDQHLDWVIKKRLLEAYIDRHGFDWKDSRVQMIDLQYHDLRPNKGLYLRLLKNGRIVTIVNHEEVVRAMTQPPTDTRAYFRGTCLRKFTQDIYSANWNSMVFCIDDSALDKVFMDRPHFGSKALVGDLLNCDSARQLVEKIRLANDRLDQVGDLSPNEAGGTKDVV